jgi:hypothetical protein
MSQPHPSIVPLAIGVIGMPLWHDGGGQCIWCPQSQAWRPPHQFRHLCALGHRFCYRLTEDSK